MATLAQAVAPTSTTRKRLVQVIALSWFAVIGLDFLLNAGLFAPFYRFDLPGFLSPMKMFQRIPLGYASYLVQNILLGWMMVRIGVMGGKAGAIFGAKFGVLIGGAGLLGWLSLFSYPALMLSCWAVFYALAATLAGMVIGSGLAAQRLRPMVLRLVAFFVICILCAVVMQSLGLVPAVKVYEIPS